MFIELTEERRKITINTKHVTHFYENKSIRGPQKTQIAVLDTEAFWVFEDYETVKELIKNAHEKSS
jgi:hypothetical protein